MPQICCGCKVIEHFSASSVVAFIVCVFLHGCYFEIPVKKKSMGMDGHTHNVWAGIFTETPV